MTWIDRYFYKPSFFQKILIFCLLPLSWLYTLIAVLNTGFRKKLSFDIPLISVGNLELGGSGKTPMCKLIASFYPQTFVVLRGYKRKSKGLLVIKHEKKLLKSLEEAGDEAYEYALCAEVAGVIVSEKREDAIKKAIELGAKIVLLDDGFSKFHIKKFDILLFSKPSPKYSFCLPSGRYRLPLCFKNRANYVAFEELDFKRHSYTKENPKALLISTIAKPFRLYEHFIKARACYFFKDHESPSKEELERLLQKHSCDTLMLTMKDFVKIKDFGFKTQLISLEIIMFSPLKKAIDEYIRTFDL